MKAPKNDVSRIIVELPKEQHRKLKSRAALLGKSMREIILESLEATDVCLHSDHYPNKETQKSLKNSEEGKNLTEISLSELSKKLGL
jgi:hypothetical protein